MPIITPQKIYKNHTLKIFNIVIKKLKKFKNFEINTNYFHRSKLKKLISDNDLFYIEDMKLDNFDYLNKLNQFQYVF